VLGLQTGWQGSLCGLVNWRQQAFCMSAFGDWTRCLLVRRMAAAESGGGTPNLAERENVQCLLMLAWIRVSMVVGYSCFGLSLLPLFLAGTFFGLPLFYPQKKIMGNKSQVLELRVHACLPWMSLALRVQCFFRSQPSNSQQYLSSFVYALWVVFPVGGAIVPEPRAKGCCLQRLRRLALEFCLM